MSDYYDLGDYSRNDHHQASEDAQRWFDRGLNWCYGYNHEEAVACHQRALEGRPRLLPWLGGASRMLPAATITSLGKRSTKS